MLTTTTRLIHGRLVSITADTEVQPQTNGVLDDLAAASPHLLVPDTSFRIGWGSFFVVARESHVQLMTLEHVQSSGAIQARTDDLTTDLQVLAGLETFGDIVGTRGPIPRFSDMIWIEDGVDVAHDIYVERRYDPSDTHSGCFIGVCDEGARARIRTTRINSLLHCRPSAIQCLAMPVGAFALLHDDRLTAVVTADGTDLWDDAPVCRPATHPALQFLDQARARSGGDPLPIVEVA